MIFKNAKLKGRIVEKFGSQAKFATALGVTEATINNKLNGARKMSQDDVYAWADALEISAEDVGPYFYEELVK